VSKSKLIALLRRSAVNAGASTRFCPDDATIAGFVDGGLHDAQRRSVLHHLYDCPTCVQRVGHLTRLLRETVPQRKTTRTSRRALARDVVPWATAAGLLLTLGWLTLTPGVPVSDYSETRSSGAGATAPEILAPRSGIIANSSETLIRWTEVPGASSYDVVIVSEIGDVVASKSVHESQLLIDREFGLTPGRNYYVRIDARIGDEQSVRSEHIPLRVVDP